MIVDSALYRRGARASGGTTPAELGALRKQAVETGDFVWVGLHEPTAEELADVASVFGLHRLAVEDALKAHQRPKLERYGDSLFLVLKSLWYVDADDAVETGEVNIFLGADLVITVRHGQGGSLAQIRARLEQHPELLAHGPTAVTHAICDHAVDDYQLVVTALQEDVDEVEASVFSVERTDDSPRIYVLKREIAEVRRAVLPLRDPMHRAAAGTVPGIAEAAAPFFRDIADHLVRVADSVEELDGLFSAQQTRGLRRRPGRRFCGPTPCRNNHQFGGTTASSAGTRSTAPLKAPVIIRNCERPASGSGAGSTPIPSPDANPRERPVIGE